MRVSLTPGVVLHQRAFEDHHSIIDCLTRDFGRISLMARGLRGKSSRRAGIVQPFCELLLSYSGRGDLPLLGAVEPQGPGRPQLQGTRLLSALYLNELILKLLPPLDPHPLIYRHYLETIARLPQGQLGDLLRRFELNLLDELGYGLILAHDNQGRALQAEAVYQVHPEREPRVLQTVANQPDQVHGATLIALQSGRFDSPRDRRESRRLMSLMIDHHLDGSVLKTRAMLKNYHDTHR